MDHGQRIREVWADNLDDEMQRMRRVARKHRYVAMDTEFPGVVVTRLPPPATATTTAGGGGDHRYQLLRRNVDLLKPIQLGLTFANERGEFPPAGGGGGDTTTPTCTWQFNFKFSLAEDRYAADSVELLTASGVQFARHADEGIETRRFAELLLGTAATTSGGGASSPVLGEGVAWLSFHGGYDFAYLLKILMSADDVGAGLLPEDEVGFFALLRRLFPVVYDVKYLMLSCRDLRGGLQKVAEQLELERPLGARPHQAGSDSLLTASAFFRMREMYFEGRIDDAKYRGQLYGLQGSSVASLVTREEESDDEQPKTPIDESNMRQPPPRFFASPIQKNTAFAGHCYRADKEVISFSSLESCLNADQR